MTAVAHVLPFPFVLEWFDRGTTVWRIDPNAGKTIYLTFDDGPNPTATPELLDLLKEKDVRATFFIIDDHLTEQTAPIVRRMFEEGHTVAQHTSRRWLLVRSPSEMREFLNESADRMQRLTGRRPSPFFRPHAGWRSIPMFRGVRKAGYKLVAWSWMSWDWVGFRKRTGERVAAHIVKHAAPGKIVVIHDGHHRDPKADRDYAIEATALIVDQLRAKGYRFEGLSAASI